MKLLIALVINLYSLTVFSHEIVIYDVPESKLYEVRNIRKDFEINPVPSRAWIELNFDTRYLESTIPSVAIMLPNLSFNPNSNEIIIQTQESTIVCAKVKKTFVGYKIKPTGNCKFNEINYTAEIDNGRQINYVERLKIVFSY